MIDELPDITAIIDLMHKHSGVKLYQANAKLIITKLQPLFSQYKVADITGLIKLIQKDPKLVTKIIDMLAVNETAFYRDRYPFELLHKYIIPYIRKYNGGSIRLLSGACSTGQEPYSLAMKFLDNRSFNSGYKIIAVDLSETALNKAKSGIYNKFEAQRGLSDLLLNKHFTQVEGKWKINSDVQKGIIFRKFNMLEDLSILGKFDIVFCRNLLIYLDNESRKKLVDNIKKIMNPGAILVIGALESLLWEDKSLNAVTEYNGIYAYQ